MIKPRTAVPALQVNLVEGGSWRLADSPPEYMAMLVFYRG